jgi:hypothetical protein
MAQNREGIEVLRDARPTAVGQALLDGMRALEAWQRTQVTA